MKLRAAVLTAVLVIAPAPALAATVPVPDLMLAQRPLVAAAEKLQAEFSHRPGFAGIVLDSAQVTLWWKGTPPTTLSTPLVRVAAARHSLAELRAAAQKIRSLGHSVKLPGDGSGLVLSAPVGAFVSAATASSVAGVPVKVVNEPALLPVSRPNDSPPWKGGARTWNRNSNSICTSGFGVRNAANARYILTAEHCGGAGHRIDDGTGEFIGNVGPRHDPHDIELIPTSNVTNTIYVGGGTSNTTTTVTGWGHVFVGQYLCQGGVTSAEQTGAPVCNIKVLFFYQDAEDLVEGEQVNGQIAARGGDSGGPVYSAGTGGVVANGTVTRAGGARIGFQDFATANRDFGVSIP